MKQKGSYIGMFVHHTGLKMVSLTLTRKLNVVKVQKVSGPGHDPGFESNLLTLSG